MAGAKDDALSLQDLEARRVLDRFVGRAAEVRRLREALARSEPQVFYVWGPGGIGKTTLLQAFAAEVRREGHPLGRVDARYVELTVPAVLAALEDAGLAADRADEPRVILLDTYEHLRPIEPQLLREFIGRLKGPTILVIAGRLAPSAEWRSLSLWGAAIQPMKLGGLESSEAEAYFARRGIPAEVAAQIQVFSHGHPLALAIAADAWQNAPDVPFSPADTPDVVAALYDYFVRGVAEHERRAALEVLAVLHTTSEAKLSMMLEQPETAGVFGWLRNLSFVQLGRRGLLPHDLAREVILAELRWRNPERLSALALRAQRHLTDQMRTRAGDDVGTLLDELSFVIGHDPQLRMMRVHPDNGLAPDDMRAGDEIAMRELVLAHEGPESARRLEYWLEHQPSAFKVVRDLNGAVAALGAFLRLDLMTAAQRDGDPTTAAVWRHAEATLGQPPPGAVCYAQFVLARGTGQAPSTAMGMCWVIGARGLLINRVVLAYARLFAGPAWDPLVISSGAHFVPSLAHDEDGHSYAVTLQDLRTRPLLDLMATMSARAATGRWQDEPETATPTTFEASALEAHLRDALRALHDNARLAENPLTQSPAITARAGVGSAARARVLRTVLVDEIDALRGSERGDAWHRVLVAAYVDRKGKHEVIAAELGLSYATFRRLLTAATEALAGRLAMAGDAPDS